MPVTAITSETQLASVLSSAGGKLVAIDFTAVWCGPCKIIGPVFEQLSNQFPNVIFTKVDVDKNQSIARAYNVSAMPTFVFIKNSKPVDRLQGANPAGLRAMIQKHATAAEASGSGSSSGSSPAFGSSLVSYIEKANLACLNENADNNVRNLFQSSGYLESDADEQLLISIPTQQIVKVKALKFKTAATELKKAPLKIKLFVDRFNLGFDEAESEEATQELTLTEAQAKGDEAVELRFVRFIKVSSLSIFVLSNQGEGDETRIDSLDILGDSGEVSGSVADMHKHSHDDE